MTRSVKTQFHKYNEIVRSSSCAPVALIRVVVLQAEGQKQQQTNVVRNEWPIYFSKSLDFNQRDFFPFITSHTFSEWIRSIFTFQSSV